ncbi:type 1 fimbrial protein [Yersinia enterocolitica]|nr:type 1 fimbrial protein [Yersinia enterocolitica]HDL8433564.1 type 1 fimbrial protein [Yersinia enterocolitica]
MNITMKKKLIVTSLLAASVFASAANAGTFNITGKITATDCVASAEVAGIKMPEINLNDLGRTAGNFAATDTDITIKLTGCPAIQKTAIVTFTGTEDTTNPKALKLNGVEGIALALFEKDGTKEIEINKAAVDQPLDGSVEHKLKYKVKYVTTSTVFKPGDATASLDFAVAYN